MLTKRGLKRSSVKRLTHSHCTKMVILNNEYAPLVYKLLMIQLHPQRVIWLRRHPLLSKILKKWKSF